MSGITSLPFGGDSERGFHSNNSESVAKRQDDFLDATVLGNQIIEGLNTFRLQVAIPWMLQNMPIPQGIVGHNKASGIHQGQQHLVICHVFPLVGINKSEVPTLLHLRDELQGIADVEVNLVPIGTPLEPLPQEVFVLVEHLEGVNLSLLLQTLRHT